MTAPADSTEFLRQALRDIFVALMLDGYDGTDIRIMAEGEADSAISVYHRDYGAPRRDPDGLAAIRMSRGVDSSVHGPGKKPRRGVSRPRHDTEGMIFDA